jgi:serine protease Do
LAGAWQSQADLPSLVWLVSGGPFFYGAGMCRPFALIVVAALCGPLRLSADVIELKDNASVSGRILAERGDQVFLDLGFTVLSVPRSAIERISRTASGAPVPVAVPTGKVVATEPDKLPAPAAGRPTGDLSLRELVNRLGEAVVQVRTPSALGSGFILNKDGDLVTNFHVIEGETQISVEVYHQVGGRLDRKVYKQVRIIAVNKFADLALLKIEDKDAPAFVTAPLGDADALSVGQTVFAIGSPLGLERTVTEGIISTRTREFQGALYLQTTAQINPGNSGGPLFNLAGQVVGVINMKVTFGEGIGFAIPVNMLKYFLDHRDAFAYANDNPSNPYRYLEPPTRLRRAWDAVE